MPANVTASASGFNPLPPQIGQAVRSTKRRVRSRIVSLVVFASVCNT